MRASRTKAVLSILATLTSGVLALVYWLAPVDATSHRLHVLLIDCIPDAVVVLIAIPVVYWLFYRRGLTNMGDCPLFSEDGTDATTDRAPHRHRRVPRKSREAAGDTTIESRKPAGEQDVLVVVDMRQDLPPGRLASRDAASTIDALNATLHTAESRAMLVLLARQRQPAERAVATREDSPPCVVYIPADSVVFDIDVPPGAPGCSALKNPALDLILSNPAVRTVYIAGIALEYSVQVTCRNLLQRGKKTVALETAIVTASESPEQVERVWRQLATEGLGRAAHLPTLGKE